MKILRVNFIKALIVISAVMLVFTAAGCGNNIKSTTGQPADTGQPVDAPKELKKIIVASHTSPMTDILDLIKDDLKSDGYEIELMKVSDNVQANVALNNKEADANFFQHELFMSMFNEGNEGTLVSVQPVYNAVVAFYGKKIKSVDDIKDGASIGIPSDPTNMTRALRLLAANGLISLKEPDSYKQTVESISDNPKNLDIKAISLLNLNEAYEELDLVFNYPAYASKIGLKSNVDGIMVEIPDPVFAITLVARKDNMDSDMIKTLIKYIKSDSVKKFIEENLENHAVPAF